MNEHARNQALDRAFDRFTNQTKQLENERKEKTITLKEYDTRFKEVRIHYNNSVHEIEKTYQKPVAA